MKYINQLKKLRQEKLLKYADILKIDSYLEQCRSIVKKYPDKYSIVLESCYKLYELDKTEIPPFKHLVDWIND